MLAKITAALIAFGPAGVLLLGFIDSAGIPVAAGMDALIILMGVKAPEHAWTTALFALLGSLGGNLLLFYLSRRGGQRFARKEKPAEGRSARFEAWFQRYGLITVFIPAVLPIPLPLKVFVVSAGVFRTSAVRFTAVIVLARFIRYFGEAYLAVRLGQDAHHFLKTNAWNMIGIAVLMFLALFFAVRWSDRRRAAAGASE